MELWKPITGYEGLYEVSNLGNVKSLAKPHGNYITKERILKPQNHPDGHYLINLKHKGHSKTFRKARLVGIEWVPNPENKRTINHKDLNKKNDRAKNLEWATHSEQIYHSWATDKERGSNSVEVVETTIKGKVIFTHKSLIAATKAYNVYKGTLRRWAERYKEVKPGILIMFKRDIKKYKRCLKETKGGKK